MLAVLHVCDKDLPSAIRNLEWCIEMDGRVDFKALISGERHIDMTALVETATRYFSTVDVFRYDPFRGDPSWPQPQNNAWQETARYIESTKTKDSWFWWEQDAIPVKPGWLSILASAHAHGGRPFSGAVTNLMGNHYVAGVAVYPPNISHHLMYALLASTQSFDIVASVRDGMLKKSHDISPLITHTPDKDNTRFNTTEDVVRYMPDTAVIFHKCKDGSLLDVLQGKTPLEVQTARIGVQYPSFTEQTQWPCGLFTFPTTTVPTAYFNCSIVEKDGDKWLFTRRTRFGTDPAVINSNTNDLAIWRIRPNMTLDPTPILPSKPNRFQHEQWEDPRAMIGNDGQTYVSFATWIHYKNWPGRQSLTRLNREWRKFDVVLEPMYGGNAPRPEKATGWEKNWVWFEHENKWHAVYTINPHVTIPIDYQGNAGTPYTNKHLDLPWPHGDPRGGTMPVRIGDEYLCFFHSSATWKKPKRRYFMGAYTFSAHPPFELLRMTPEPLLVGSDQDFRALGGPLVIFPNGALLEHGHWLVVFGVNDENCGWIKIPHAELDEKLIYAGRKKGLVETLVEKVTG